MLKQIFNFSTVTLMIVLSLIGTVSVFDKLGVSTILDDSKASGFSDGYLDAETRSLISEELRKYDCEYFFSNANWSGSELYNTYNYIGNFSSVKNNADEVISNLPVDCTYYSQNGDIIFDFALYTYTEDSDMSLSFADRVISTNLKTISKNLASGELLNSWIGYYQGPDLYNQSYCRFNFYHSQNLFDYAELVFKDLNCTENLGERNEQIMSFIAQVIGNQIYNSFYKFIR